MRNLVTRFIFFTMIASGLSLWNAACVKDCDMRGRTYKFQLPLSLIYYKDTYHVGDTITVVCRYSPSAVLNAVNNRTENLINVHINPLLHIYKIDTVDEKQFNSGFNNFKFICPKDNGCEYVYAEKSVGLIQYEHEIMNAMAEDTFTFIPQNKGIYQVEFDSRNQVYRGETFPGKCPRSSYRFEWAYDEKYSNDRLTQYVQYCKIEGMKKYLMNTDPQKFTFGVYVK